MLFKLFTDETNNRPSKYSKFFLYGGIFLNVEKMPKISEEISKIRSKYKFDKCDEFKFEINSCPKSVQKQSFANAKSEVLNVALKYNLKFVACLVSHKVAENKEEKILIQWGANTILAAFNSYLEKNKGFGLVQMDRLPWKNNFDFLKEKFQNGLVFKDNRIVELNRILSYSMSCDGASNFSSLADILIGSFRHCVNDERNTPAVREMLPKIVKLMDAEGGKLQDKSLFLRPKYRGSEHHNKEYVSLVLRLNKLLNKN